MLTCSNVTQTDLTKFVAFASDLGWKPGEWPAEIKTTMGNKMSFRPYSKKMKDGVIEYVRYRQDKGILDVVVFND